MKKVLSLFLTLVMLLTMFSAVPFTAAATEEQTEIYPTPTEIVAGPVVFKGEAQSGSNFSAYISNEKAQTVYNKYLISDFNLDFSAFNDWSSLYIYLDSATSRLQDGFAFQISGPSSFASNSKDFVETPSGCGVIFRKENAIVDAAPLNTDKLGVIYTDYRIIIKRVIGDTDTSVEFYMFEKGTPVPSTPMFDFTYTNEEYGSAAASLAFSTWECSKSTVSDIKLYNYNIATKQNPQSIDDPVLLPRKAVENQAISWNADATGHGDIHISSEEATTEYGKYLVADMLFDASAIGTWGSASLYLDSENTDDTSGFRFFIGGSGTFKGKAQTAGIENPSGTGVVLYGSVNGAKQAILDAAELGMNEAGLCNTVFRIIVKRVVGDNDTRVQFYMFDANTDIPSEPMFDFTYTNAQYGTPSTSMKFTTWSYINFIYDMKLYNYDISIAPYTESATSVENPANIPTKTVEGSATYKGNSSKEILQCSYVSQSDSALGTYSKYLISDFDISFNNFGVWKSISLYLDSWDSNNWQGYKFMIAGSTSFANKVSGGTGTGIILYKLKDNTQTIIDSYDFGVPEWEFQDIEYRIILKRVIGETRTAVEFYMFPKDDAIPSEPMFEFSYTNEEYGPASTSISFRTWEDVEFTVSDMKLYNYNLSVEPYVPFIGNRIETPATPEEYEEVESTVITRTSDSDQRWLDTKTAPADYDYAFAVVGDTQYINKHNPESYPAIYDWILDNVDDKKIKFVAGLGDITESSTEAEWVLAQEQITRLDGLVPYSIVRGNHDGKKGYNQYFPYENYADTLGGSFDGTMLNTYQELVIGRNKYLIMGLDYGCDDDVLEWANEVASAYPDHNIIVTTHGYLDKDGSLIVDGMITNNGFNTGGDIWHKFIKKHSNITMVLAGHVINEDIVAVQSKGENGNIVTQMLINPQSLDHLNSADRPTGMVCMLYFSEGGSKVEVEYYSTVKQQYFKDINQFTMDVAVVDNSVEGDITGDNKVDAADLIALRINLIGNTEYDALYDINEDGSCNVVDLVKLKKLCVKDTSTAS